MSLNGLENADVQAAYQAAIPEAGGWFLLKYASRDSVELLGRGKAGVHEARTAIASYTDASPLYGLIIYRRRKVLIKYVPDGTSRVLLARTAVHMQDVQEKYSPYECVLSISTADGLNDTSLAASFPLHTATPSASSTRLDEINEDEGEEDGLQPRAASKPKASKSSYFSAKRQRKDPRLERIPPPPPAIHVRGDSLDTPVTPPSPVAGSSGAQSPSLEDPRQQLIDSLMGPPASTLPKSSNVQETKDERNSLAGSATLNANTPTSPPVKALPDVPPADAAAPKLPERSNARYSRNTEVRAPKGLPEQPTTERPSTSTTIATTSTVSDPPKHDEDPYDLSKFDIKPKQKLGPRPVVSGEKTKRPTVASISSVPATYRPTSKQPELSRPKSQGPISGAVMATGIAKGLPAPPPIPDLPEYTPRPLSRGSIKSLPSHKSTAMTPDKIRLMKAVELRKKQMRKSNPHAASFVPPPDEDVPAVPSIPEPSKQEPGPEPEPEPVTRKSEEREIAVSIPDKIASKELVQTKKPDSGIEMEYERHHKTDDEVEVEPAPSKAEEVPQQVPPQVTGAPSEATAQLPRIDTPREIAGQFSGEDEARQVHIFDARTRHDEPQKSLGLDDVDKQASPTMFRPETATHDDLEEQGPSLPMSRHALPVDASRRDESIDEPRPSEDDAANVPTIIMEDGSRPLSALIKQARSEDSSSDESEPEDRSPYESVNSSSADLAPPEKIIRRQNSDIAKRRRGYIEPLQLDGDIEFSSDEEFMDELQSAEVQEAKPITVARSPVAHYFPRRPSNYSGVSDVDGTSVRTITVGDRASTLPVEYTDSQGRLSPEATSYSPDHARSISTVSSSEKADSSSSARRNVSSGISKRIQALAEKSSQENMHNGTSSSSSPVSPATSTNGFISPDSRQQARSPPLPSSRTSSWRAISRHSSRISAYQSLMGSQTPPAQETNTVWNVENDRQSGVGSVSVTARIVRPVASAESSPNTDMEADLQPSKLVVSSHKRGTGSQSSIRQPQRGDAESRPESINATSNRSSTLARNSQDTTRQLHSASKFGRHKPSSPTVEDFPIPPPSTRAPAVQPVSVPEDSVAPKESTRTSRFFKRMSNIGNKRKSTIAQSIASSGSPASERGSLIAHNFSGSREKMDMPPALTVGDLNIQFPDSLLWKRRIVEIDDTGCLIFYISQAMEHQRNTAKKYHLSDFRMPYIPDLDRQELPNSIMLDFIDGTTLQIACEDSMTHRQVTNILKSYWRAWTSA